MAEFLGVAVLPRIEAMEEVIAIQSGLDTDSSLKPHLSADGNLPHVTLFQGPFKAGADFLKSLIAIRDLAVPAGQIGAEGLGVFYQPKGWIFLNLKTTEAFSRLQKAALNVCEPYLDLSAVDRTRDTSGYTSTEKASYDQYGYRYVGTAFRPHITLGHADEHTAMKLVEKARAECVGTGLWLFDRLSFYVMGETGAHAEQLAVLRL